MLDINKIKEQFPFFKQLKNGKPWVFLDNAASSQKPESVLRVMDEFYRTSYANVHRGIYDVAENATALFESARETVARFVGTPDASEIIFTKNTTEAINFLAYTLGATLKHGDEILLTEMEHHANLVPWQQAILRTGAKLRFIPLDSNFRLDLSKLSEVLNQHTRIVSVTAMSNVLGTINDIKYIIEQAHKYKAKVVIDAAQALAHFPLNVTELDCDFLAFSGHKIFGPSGIGVLFGKQEYLKLLPPFLTGGHMISDVWWDHATWNEIPAKFEAGTPPITEGVGFGEAIKFINEIGWPSIIEHEKKLTDYGLEQLQKMNNLQLFGPKDSISRGALFSFTLDKIHAHDVAGILNESGVAARAGHHCAAPLHKKFGLTATTRASCAVYNTTEDIDRLVDGLKQAQKMLT
ncbi:MAG: SufS family cysteine desulfurase [Patescibacteria group bacterium]